MTKMPIFLILIANDIKRLNRMIALPDWFALPVLSALISDRKRGLLTGYPRIQPLIRRCATTSPKRRSESLEFPTRILRIGDAKIRLSLLGEAGRRPGEGFGDLRFMI
jgi:hypothetical protein